MNKLVEISQGKQLSVGQHSKVPAVHSLSRGGDSTRDLVSQSAFSTSAAGKDGRTKSLNIGVRKRENERIERENHQFAKRLYSNSGSISRKQLDNDFKQILGYKKMIARVKKNKPSFNGRFQHLPPLNKANS